MVDRITGGTSRAPRTFLTTPSTAGADNTRTPARITGLVQLWAPETRAIVGARYSSPPQVVAERAADGSWAPVSRIKRRPLSSWTGPQAVKIECKLRIGGTVDAPISLTLLLLRGLQDRLPGDDAPDRPPYLKVIGYVPGHYADVKWQIHGLSIEEEDHLEGEPAVAVATLTLVEWVSSEIRTTLDPTRRSASKKPWLKRDTLPRFAKRHTGSDGKQSRSAIRKANPRIKHWTNIKPGTLITVPASQSVNA